MKKSIKGIFLFAFFTGLVIFLSDSPSVANTFSETGYQNTNIINFKIDNNNNIKLAVNETDSNNLSNRNNKSKRKAKNKKSNTSTETQPEIPDINKNLVSPNESPGLNTDIEKTKKYYESIEDVHRTNKDETYNEEDFSEDDLVLPARIEKGGMSVRINTVEFTKSEIFSESEILKFKSLLEGKDATEEDLNNFIDLINAQYAKKGNITARAFITESNLNDGILNIELMEARIGKVTVEGNRFNRKWFLKSRIREKSGDVFDLQMLEKDLKQFNHQARSITLSAKLKPGEEYGTTDIVLNAKEKFPFHFTASWDSFGRDTTGLLRGGLMLSADSLFGFQDRFSVAVNKSRAATTPYIDYNIPINRKGTRLGVSYMYGNNKIISGQYSSFDLEAKTHITSGYITHPLIENEKGSLNITSSANLKFSDASTSNYKYSSFKDYNIAVGLGGHRNFKRSVLYASIYSTNGIIEDRIRKNSNYFTKFNAEGYYIHYLPKGIIATLKVGGQYSPHDMAYVEQYQIGGISSVRGYTESLLLAPSSYFASLEMLFPIPFLPETVDIPFNKDNSKFRLRDSIKFATFFDHGAVFPYDEKTGGTNFLMSVGAGLRMAFSKFLTARVYIGVPLMNTSYYEQANARVHFDLIVSPF